MKLIPDCACQGARVCKTSDAAHFQCGIKRGEIAELHGQASGGASNFSGKVNDGTVAGMKLAEVQFVVEVESDD